MSILNVLVSPTRILVAVDSMVAGERSQRGEMSKMVPLVHLNAVIAMRGHQLFLANIYAGCNGCLGDLDALFASMLDRLQACYARQNPSDLRLTAAGEFMGEQVVVAGWSPARQRMVALDYRLDEPGGEFKLRKEVDSWMLAPGDSFDSPPDRLVSAEDLAAIAAQQTRHALARDPAAGFGGRLIVAEMLRHTMTFSSSALPTK